jgi:hypothetical protein
MDVEDLTGLELTRIKVVATTGDLKDTQLNPEKDFLSLVWLLGITRQLPFNPGGWRWTMDEKEIPFFNYTSKIGYLSGMTDKKQESRLQEKLQAFHLTDSKIQASIATIWEPNKPTRLQFFAWQVASGGLFTRSRAVHMATREIVFAATTVSSKRLNTASSFVSLHGGFGVGLVAFGLLWASMLISPGETWFHVFNLALTVWKAIPPMVRHLLLPGTS